MPSVTPTMAARKNPAEQAQHGVEHVMRQDAPDGQVDEGLGDRDQRGEQLRREHAGPRHDLPQAEHHDEGKHIPRDHPPARVLGRARRPRRENAGLGGEVDHAAE